MVPWRHGLIWLLAGCDTAAEADRSMGVAGPGVSAEWTQGGRASGTRSAHWRRKLRPSRDCDFVVPRAGTYRVWVRDVDHRKKTEPFTVAIQTER